MCGVEGVCGSAVGLQALAGHLGGPQPYRRRPAAPQLANAAHAQVQEAVQVAEVGAGSGGGSGGLAVRGVGGEADAGGCWEEHGAAGAAGRDTGREKEANKYADMFRMR